jgi:hypothetical protein
LVSEVEVNRAYMHVCIEQARKQGPSSAVDYAPDVPLRDRTGSKYIDDFLLGYHDSAFKRFSASSVEYERVD